MRRDRSILLTGVLCLLPATGCDRKPAPQAHPAPAAPQVTVVKPEMRPVKRVVEQPGTVQAFEETALHAKLAGFVAAIADDPDKKDRPPHDRQIDIGSRVAKDQVLAELSIPELEQEWQQKNALVRQSDAEVVQAEKAEVAARAGVATAVSNVEVAKAGVSGAQGQYDRWQSELNRISGLVKSGVIDAQTRDETLNQFKAAEAARNEVNARVASAGAAADKARADAERALADITAAKAKLDVSKAEVRRLDALRGYTKIKAPFAGVVTRRWLNTGDFVSGTEKAGLFSVAKIDPVRVVVNVPDTDAGLVTQGQDIRVAVQAAGPESAGKVARTSWSLDPTSRTLRTEIDLPNDKGLLRPGMYVYAKLTADLPAAWSVPAAAVAKVGDESVMYLVEGGKAVRVSVQLLKGDAQFTQVRRYKKHGAGDWTDVTGAEGVATPASALSDGHSVPQ
jgi:multidrug efflux pump subunit AcrA (membrane-fusion protein)